MLTHDAGITGIDIDHCIKDGSINPKALWVIGTIASYSEISPSGSGVRILVKANIPDRFNRYKRVEIYEKGRYLTITGHQIEGSPPEIINNQTGLEIAYREIFKTHIAQESKRQVQHQPFENNQISFKR